MLIRFRILIPFNIVETLVCKFVTRISISLSRISMTGCGHILITLWVGLISKFLFKGEYRSWLKKNLGDNETFAALKILFLYKSQEAINFLWVLLICKEIHQGT